jgi:hypothetical protein
VVINPNPIFSGVFNPFRKAVNLNKIIDRTFEQIDDVLTTLRPVAGIFIAEKELVWQK